MEKQEFSLSLPLNFLTQVLSRAVLQIARFYFIFFVAQGCLIPYLPPYYKSLGFSGAKLATLASIGPFVAVFVPPLWGYAADKSRRPVRALQIAIAGATVFFLPVLVLRSFGELAAALAVQSVFLAAITSLADTVAVAEARRLGTEYGRLRVWGSVGYIIGAYAISTVLANGYGLKTALMSGAIGLVLASIFTFTIANTAPESAQAIPKLRDAGRLLHSGRFVSFLLAGMLHWAAMQSFYLLFALRVKEVGVSEQFVGFGIACSVGAEIVVLWSFRGLIKRLPLLPFLFLAVVGSALRWWLTGWVTSGVALAFIQAFHGLSFGIYYVGSIAFLEQTIPVPLRATGRALMASISLGMGGILGNSVEGRLLDYGGTSAGYFGSAVFECAALIPLAVCAALSSVQPGSEAAISERE